MNEKFDPADDSYDAILAALELVYEATLTSYESPYRWYKRYGTEVYLTSIPGGLECEK